MAEEVEVEEGEFIDYLNVQKDAFAFLQKKARNILALFVGTTTAVGTLLSIGVFDITYFSLNRTATFSLVGGSRIPAAQNDALVQVSATFAIILALFVGISLQQCITRLIRVYGYTEISPVVSVEPPSVILVREKKSNWRDREQLLNENQQKLSDISKKYRTAGFLFALIAIQLQVLIPTWYALKTSSIVMLAFGCVYPFLLLLWGSGFYAIRHPMESYCIARDVFKIMASEMPENNMMFVWNFLKFCLALAGGIFGMIVYIHISLLL